MRYMPIEIKSKEIKIVPLKDIKLNPKNRNKHPAEQLERLAEILRYQGFRVPGVISNRTGYLMAGEGRYLAAKLAGFDSMPVIYQDFESEEQEYAFGVSDNAIAEWARLDFAGINSEIGNLGPDFDLEMLGLKDFMLEPADKLDPNKEWEELDMDKYEGPEPQFRVVIYVDDTNRKAELLSALKVTDYKQHSNNKVWSLHWPQEK